MSCRWPSVAGVQDQMTQAPWHGKRAVVVEDEAVVALMLEDMLDEMGCVVAGSAARLDAAVALAREVDADFALLDLNLDGALTYPVADIFAERRLPFVLSTGYAVGMLPERFSQTPLLAKPFDLSDLKRAVGAILAGG